MTTTTVAGAMHVRLEVGSAASSDLLSSHLFNLGAVIRLADALARSGRDAESAPDLARLLVGPVAAENDEFTRMVRLASNFDRDPSQHFLSLLNVMIDGGFDARPSDVADRLAPLLRSAERAKAQPLLSLREFTYRNPADAWVELAPAIVDKAAWAAQGWAGLVILKGLLDAIRSWQERGLQMRLVKLEIKEKEMDLRVREATLDGSADRQLLASSAESARVDRQLAATVELAELVADAAGRAAEIDPSHERVAEVVARPHLALLQVHAADRAQAEQALAAIPPVIFTDLD